MDTNINWHNNFKILNSYFMEQYIVQLTLKGKYWVSSKIQLLWKMQEQTAQMYTCAKVLLFGEMYSCKHGWFKHLSNPIPQSNTRHQLIQQFWAILWFSYSMSPAYIVMELAEGIKCYLKLIQPIRYRCNSGSDGHYGCSACAENAKAS